jgi:class 3 adenylate cyclase
MHIGSLMYGNIGIDRRLDFSVTGPAANEVVRLGGSLQRAEDAGYCLLKF